MTWENFSLYDEMPLKYTEVEKKIPILIDKNYIIKNNKKICYYNIPCAFDIETTSFYSCQQDGEKEKKATMYLWQLGLNGSVFIGRTWTEFINSIDIISKYLELGENKRLIIYVHNLSFEFQFIRKLFEWCKVFALDTRKVAYACTTHGIEFRCSYILSGYNLETLGKNLHKYKCEKLVGELDYNLIRHSKTQLTEKEIKYGVNDVKVVMSYIQETIETVGNITKIPLTNTGYVRDYCRNNCLYDGGHKNNMKKYLKYRSLMNDLTLEADEVEQLNRAFQGGFTHANNFYSGQTIEKVGSFDETSAYPFVMVAEKFPMSRGKKVKINSEKDFNNYITKYCCIFDVRFINICSSVLYEHPISISRCFKKENYTADNGRLVKADSVFTTVTEQDYIIYKNFYEWEHVEIYNFRIYKKDYLPTDFVKSILKLYSDKTVLKGVEGSEVEYMKSKGMLNSAYGMSVTAILRDNIEYNNNEWTAEKPDIYSTIEKYNKNKRRFLFFAWGVYITAYARRNLFTGIKEFNNDYVYSDTDSVKGLNAEKHLPYIIKYNNNCVEKLKKACEYHKIDFALCTPKTIKGETKILGVWEDEGEYSKFKTIGAKRYITEKNGIINITVSGVNKKVATPYLQKKYKDVFKAFNDGLEIPKEYTGKLTHTYIDNEISGYLTDYLGNTEYYNELSAIHLEQAEYSLSLSADYINYLKGVKEIEK